MTCSGLPANFLPQHRVLRGDADRAGVQVALAHHDAAERDRAAPVAEADLLGAEQRGDHHVAAGLDLAVGLQHHAAAQVVHHQRLVRLGDAQFPRQAGVLDARERRRAGAAGIAGDQDVIGVRLGDAGGDRADADFATSFTLTRASGFAFFRSWISCARSSIE